jgi:hypothetical protein
MDEIEKLDNVTWSGHCVIPVVAALPLNGHAGHDGPAQSDQARLTGIAPVDVELVKEALPALSH